MTANNIIGLDYYGNEINVNAGNLRNLFHDDDITPRAISDRVKLFLDSAIRYSGRAKLTIRQLYGYLKREIQDNEGLDCIEFVYDNEGLGYDPHLQMLDECKDEVNGNIESLENLFDNDNFTPRAIFDRIELVFDSVFKYLSQAHLTIGHLQGYLDGYLNYN